MHSTRRVNGEPQRLYFYPASSPEAIPRRNQTTMTTQPLVTETLAPESTREFPETRSRLSQESAYYRFGLMLGLRNLLSNGFRLGFSKTLGKILQPVNFPTRYPEYAFMGTQIERYISQRGVSRNPGQRLKVLDVSSPKCFGLNLAYRYDAEIHLTDIDAASVEESEILWDSVRDRAQGQARFSLEDARALSQPAEFFDIVFSMSVIEHIEDDGAPGDSLAIREMLRVLKPGGLLLVTVPFGDRYVEQERIGFKGSAIETHDAKPYFFARIYTREAAQERILASAAGAGAQLVKATTMEDLDNQFSRLYRKIGTTCRCLLGCLNPVFSSLVSKVWDGIVPVGGEYGKLWKQADVYGILMLAWEKRV